MRTDGTKPLPAEPAVLTLMISLSDANWLVLAELLGKSSNPAMKDVAAAAEKAVALVEALPMIVKAPTN